MHIIMSEPPAPCNFKCEYCYVPENFDRRKDLKDIKSEHFLKLGERVGPGPHLYWMCGIGEPFMQPWTLECATELSKQHKVCYVTNLSYFGNDWPEKLCDLPTTHNLGMYWSVHYNEMLRTGCVGKTVERVRRMLSAGIRVWPTVVCHPTYFKHLDAIVDMCTDLGVKVIPCRYRIKQSDLAGLKEEHAIEDKYSSNPNVDFGLWDRTPDCWDVAGGQCTAGTKQVVIDAWWKICCCHGDHNKTDFGTFPEDVDKVNLKPAGLCKSSKCPCKHSVMFGVNSKFPYSFADILYDWEEFVGVTVQLGTVYRLLSCL